MYTQTSNETGAVPPRTSWLARTGVGRALAVLTVLTFGSAMAQQGGSAVVSFQDDVATLDPPGLPFRSPPRPRPRSARPWGQPP